MSTNSRRHLRLFALIEVGSTAAIKRLAAQQIADLVKENVDDIDVYLEAIWDLLRNERWETRIGAGEALRAIANNFSPFLLTAPPKYDECELSSIKFNALNLTSFSIRPFLILKSRALDSISTKVLDGATNHADHDYLTLQKQQAHNSLGINPRMQRLGLADFADELFSAEDFDMPHVPLESPTALTAVDHKLEMPRICNPVNSADSFSVCADKWPLAWLWNNCRAATNERDWKHRHGAVIGLREMSLAALQNSTNAAVRGDGVSYFSCSDMEQFVIELLTLLATDKFCDFVADETVAPIRETAAQALAACVNLPNCRNSEIRSLTMHILLYDMLGVPCDYASTEPKDAARSSNSGDWQSRFSAMLGLKYILLVSTSAIHGDCERKLLNEVCDIPERLLCELFYACCLTIDDSSEELAAASAETLIIFIDSGALMALCASAAPTDADCKPKYRAANQKLEKGGLTEKVRLIIEQFPEFLLDSDDCGAVRGAYLQLLAKLLDFEFKWQQEQRFSDHSENYDAEKSRFVSTSTKLIPVLLDASSNGSSAGVRTVALQTIFGVARKICVELKAVVKNPEEVETLLNIGQLLEHVLLRAMVEPAEQITHIISTKWKFFVDVSFEIASGEMCDTFFERLPLWLNIAMQPFGAVISFDDITASNCSVRRQSFFAGGDAALVSRAANETTPDAVNGEARATQAEQRALRTRNQASSMLAYLFCKLSPLMMTANVSGTGNKLRHLICNLLMPCLTDSQASYTEREVVLLFIASVGKHINNWFGLHNAQILALNPGRDVNMTVDDADVFTRTDYLQSFDYIKRCLFVNALYPELASPKMILCSSLSVCIKEMHTAALKLLRAAMVLNLQLPSSLSDQPHVTSSEIETRTSTAIFNFDQVRQLCISVLQQLENFDADEQFYELLTAAQEAYEKAGALTRACNQRYRAEVCCSIIALVPHVYLPSAQLQNEKLIVASKDALSNAAVTLPLNQALLIRPLMDLLRNETVPEYQLLATDALATLVVDFIGEQVPGQTAKKVIRNMLGMSCRRIFSGCKGGGVSDLPQSLRGASTFAEKSSLGAASKPDETACINEWLNSTFSAGERINETRGLLSVFQLDSSYKISELAESLLDQLARNTDDKSADVLKRRRVASLRILRRVFAAYMEPSDATNFTVHTLFVDGPLTDAFKQNDVRAATFDVVELTDAMNILTLIVKAVNLQTLLAKASAEPLSAAFCEWFRHLAETLTRFWLHHQSTVVRYYAANLYAVCLSTLIMPLIDCPVSSMTDENVRMWQNVVILDFIMPLAAQDSSFASNINFFEYGLTEALYQFVLQADQRVQLHVATVLAVPLVLRINSSNAEIRALASNCFGSLVELLPLLTNTSGRPATVAKNSCFEWLKRHDSESCRMVIEQAALCQHLDTSSLCSSPASLPVCLDNLLISNVKLRPYQESGVSWLTFLQKLNLGGILCDDMGLGKTLQTLCVIAASAVDAKTRSPTLVICPATLILHWGHECSKFISSNVLRPIVIATNQLQTDEDDTFFDGHHLLIISYDTARRFCQHSLLRKTQFNYVVLDEGHLVRNTKTKTYQAIAALVTRSQHRLILTGTPIQNHVHELWSLFEFLMPGYLGSEKQFQARYGKPIAQANAATARFCSGGGSATNSSTASINGRELEAGTLALHELHQRILPFILRRLKTHVLKDLPPKLVQDYLCELSDLQRILYDDFQQSELVREMCTDDASQSKSGAKPQQQKYGVAFKALHYLRQICNHPKFVLQPEHPQFDSIRQRLLAERGDSADKDAVFADLLDSIEHSGKLLALKDLLLSCGIGAEQQINGNNSEESDPAAQQQQHRALIFFQSRSTLKLVERIVLQRELPSVRYLTLTGAMPALARANAVDQFNRVDSVFDVMLLTTAAGGLGLNLTGADTVIFVEHDWNPQRDLQAMDRAHRIGQKRVVSVYRLVTRNTLEEKIMGLQKFKLFMADTIVNGDNIDPLNSLQAEEFMSLFARSAAEAVDNSNNSSRSLKRQAADDRGSGPKTNSRSLSALLENYNPDRDYEEFQPNAFLKKLKP